MPIHEGTSPNPIPIESLRRGQVMVDSCLYILYVSTTKTGPLWRGQGGVPQTGRNTGAQRCLISVLFSKPKMWPLMVFGLCAPGVHLTPPRLPTTIAPGPGSSFGKVVCLRYLFLRSRPECHEPWFWFCNVCFSGSDLESFFVVGTPL